MGDILNKKKKKKCVCIHEIIWKWKIDYMAWHIVNIRIIRVWWCLYVLSFIHERVKQRRGWLEKKSVGYKKACISLVPIIHSLFRREFEVIFAWIAWIGFARSDFVDSEIVIWGLISLTDFYKRVHLLFKKRHVSDCQKKISFVQITHLKFTFLTPYDIKSYYK